MPFEIFGKSFFGKKQEKQNQELAEKYIEAKLSFYDFASGYNGDKTGFFSGFGLSRDLTCVDLVTLQYRSLQLSRENPFVAAILGRLVTKVINSGLVLRSNPNSFMLSMFSFFVAWYNLITISISKLKKPPSDFSLSTYISYHLLYNLSRDLVKFFLNDFEYLQNNCILCNKLIPMLFFGINYFEQIG